MATRDNGMRAGVGEGGGGNKGADRDNGMRAPAGTGNAGYANRAGTGYGPPKAPTREPNFLDKLLGYDSVDQRVRAYQNNPNRPNYDTKTMGVPVDMSWSNVPFGPNYGMPNPLGVGIGLMSMGATGLGPGLALTRAIQAATGMSGGPAIGGRSDGKGTFGGQAGAERDLNKGAFGYQLLPTQATQPGVTPLAPVAAAAEPAAIQAQERKKRMYALGMNGVPGPSPYSYQTAKWL